MADKNLVQQIDKISYAVATVAGLALLILPIFYGGDIAETRESLNRAAGELARKKEEQPFPSLPDRNLKSAIQSQWRPGSGGDSPTWITDATPCLVKRVTSIKQQPAAHEPGIISEISAHRDSDKKQVYLTVKGEMGPGNEFVIIERVELFRREGAAGDFKPVGTFKGAFEYQDYKVTAGETYAYRFTTVASRDPSAPSNILPPEAAEQESAAVETPPIPYDFSIKVRQFFPVQQLGERPTVMADFTYWDYEKGEVVPKDRGRYTERERIGGRYEISQIRESQRSILVKDGIRRTRHDISSKDEPYPVELWAPVSGAAVEAAPSGEEAVEEAGEAAPQEAAPPEAKAPEPQERTEPEPEVDAEPDPEAPAEEAPAPQGGSRRRRGF